MCRHRRRRVCDSRGHRTPSSRRRLRARSAATRVLLLLLQRRARTHAPARARGGSAARTRPSADRDDDDDRRRPIGRAACAAPHRPSHALSVPFHLLALRERHASAIAAQQHMMTANAACGGGGAHFSPATHCNHGIPTGAGVSKRYVSRAMPDATDAAPATTDGAGETRLGSSQTSESMYDAGDASRYVVHESSTTHSRW